MTVLNKVSENLEAVKRMAGSAVLNIQCKTHFNSSESRDMSRVLDCIKVTACKCLRA